MTTKNTLLWLPLAVLLGACGDNSGSAASLSVMHSASCIADYAQRACDLLTPELVAGVYVDLPDDINSEETAATRSCQHSWPGERTQLLKAGNIEMEVPLRNRVGISWIEKKKDAESAEAWFRHVYRTLSAEEKAATLAALDKELEKQTAGLSEVQKELAGSFGRDLINANRYETIEGVGTAAAWDANPLSPTLKVLSGDTEFGIEADISADSSVNRDLAIALARAVIAACP